MYRTLHFCKRHVQSKYVHGWVEDGLRFVGLWVIFMFFLFMLFFRQLCAHKLYNKKL